MALFIDETTGNPYTVQYSADGSMTKVFSDGRRLTTPAPLVKGGRDCPGCGSGHDAASKDRYCDQCGSMLPLRGGDDEVQKIHGLVRAARAGRTEAVSLLVKAVGSAKFAVDLFDEGETP